MVAKKESVQRGKAAREGIFLNENEHLVEGIVSNLFFVRGDVVFTPDERTGLVPGVTRNFIMKLCRDLDIEVNEGFYSYGDLLHSDEAFITNSIQEIVPVECIDDVPLPQAKGKVTSKLAGKYSQAVSRL